MKMNTYQRTALNAFLSNYPDDCNYHDVLNLLDEDSEEVLIWEPLQSYDGKYISEQIECLKDTLEHNFIERLI